jgi:hypothetical protein
MRRATSDPKPRSYSRGCFSAPGDEYEERKVPLVAHFFAEVAFRDDISLGYAHHLLRVTDRLSFRELCLLALYGDPERLRTADLEGIRRGQMIHDPPPSLIAELDHLGSENLLGVRQEDRSVAHFASVWNGGTFSKLEDDSKIALTSLGRDLFDLLGLASLTWDELGPIYVELRGFAGTTDS